MTLPEKPIRWFSETLQLTGVAHTDPESFGNSDFIGKRVGLINGSSWIVPWANYFGRLFIPGAHLINIGNEALQINFMEAFEHGQPTPPKSNIDAFVSYARDLAELGHVDVILITCSTMNRSYTTVVEAMKSYGIPIIQIDRPMMEKAVKRGGKCLVIATHGPTVASTQSLLCETSTELKMPLEFVGETVEDAWFYLAKGEVEEHNDLLAQTIKKHQETETIDSVVLAQLSMTVFLLSNPDPQKTFGIPVFTSGQCGFERVSEVLTMRSQ